VNEELLTGIDADGLERYLARIGLDGTDHSLEELQLAHVRSIPYENLDIHLGREIRLDVPSLVSKLVDGRRGGYCYEQNTLYAAVLEALGLSLTRCLGRVRLGDAESPRPATHMVLLVDSQLVDVGFGSATPLGPIPLGGEATYGGWTWTTERARSPEGEDVWQVRLLDTVLYTFADRPQHPVDYIAPNHYSSTHPKSVFTQNTVAQRWDKTDVQVALIGLELTERRADGAVETTTIDLADYDSVLSTRFDLDLADDELARLTPMRST
jgi:N-hydroxyarylamine O-acetyltransferase